MTASVTAILTTASPYTLDAPFAGEAAMPRAARRAGRIVARRQRVQCGWLRFTAAPSAAGGEGVATMRAIPRAGTSANKEAATHTVWLPGGITTRGGLTPDGTLWYIPR